MHLLTGSPASQPTRHAAVADAPAPDPGLLELGRWLQREGYAFTCPTPATQQRVEAQDPQREARTLRDVFGWNRPFARTLLPTGALAWMRRADVLEDLDGRLRSRIRFSTLDEHLLLHSGHPTREKDAVFLGPDTHRFVAFVHAVLAAGWPWPVRRVADIGCGSGAGAIAAAAALDPGPLEQVLLRDLNPRALALAATNVALNQTPHALPSAGDVLRDVDGVFDLIIANPPYMIDGAHRLYRDGGRHHGVEVALRFLREALEHLAPGGRIALYTGTPVIEGEDLFRRAAEPLLRAAPVHVRYRELDPDVHGESLALPEYRDVERIAAVGLLVSRAGGVR